MAAIFEFPTSKRVISEPPGGGDGMDTRLTKLETKLDTILPMLATKADISDTKAAIAKAESDIIKWLAGFAAAIVAIILSVMLFVFNREFPRQPQPIIIQPQITQPAPQSPPAVNR